MDILPRPIDFGPQIAFFGIWGPIFAFLTPKSARFLQLYKISDRLMGQMTYFQPRDSADSNFFWLNQILKYSAF
jgi:hypothetical protein